MPGGGIRYAKLYQLIAGVAAARMEEAETIGKQPRKRLQEKRGASSARGVSSGGGALGVCSG